MEMTNRVLTIVFCLGLPTIIILIFAVIGTKYRLELANQISQKVKSGHYGKVATKEIYRKIRLLTAFGLIDLLFLGLWVILFASRLIFFSTLVAFGSLFVLVLLGLVSGFSLYNIIRRM